MDVTPNQPVPGQSVSVALDFTPKENILGGTFEVDVEMFKINVKHADCDLCKDAGLTCPLAKGTKYTATLHYDLPAQVPHGLKVHAAVKFTDNNGEQLSCVDTKVTTASKTTVVSMLRSAATASDSDSESDTMEL